MINKENKEEVLEALNNIVFEYKTQVFALGYLGLLSQHPEILSKAIQLAVEKEADNKVDRETREEDVIPPRTPQENQKTEEKNTLSDLVKSLLELLDKFVESLMMLTLAKNAEEKLSHLLPNSILVYSITIWESFLRDYFRVVLRYNWEVLSKLKDRKEGKSFTIGELIEIMMNYDDMREILIEEFLYTTFYGSIDEIAKRFRSLGMINLQEFPKWERLEKYYLMRNAVVHNNGKVSHKLSKELDLKAGTKIELTPENIEEVISLVYDFIDYVHDNITKKYKLELVPSLSTFLEKDGEKE